MRDAEREFWPQVVNPILITSVFFGLMLSNTSCNRHISDDRIAEMFQENRADFEQLVRMAAEDGVERVYPDHVYLMGQYFKWRPGEPGFTQERHEAYKVLLERTGTIYLSQDQHGVAICCASVVVSEIDEYESYVSSKAFYFGEWDGGAALSPIESAESNGGVPIDHRGGGKWYIRNENGIGKPE